MQYIEVHSETNRPKEFEQAKPRIYLSEFPELFAKHWDGDPSTRSVEIYAKEFVEEGMPQDRLFGFMRMVFGWGGTGNIGTNFMKHNAEKLDDVHCRFLLSLNFLNDGKDKEAIESLASLKGLRVSYASKHLKFLNPNKAVVLDLLIERGLGYQRTSDGYVEFIGKCREWMKLLNDNNIFCGRSSAGTWRVSDVEMAVFKHVEKTAPKPPKKKI